MSERWRRISAIARLSARELLRSRSMLIAAILNGIILALLGFAAYAIVMNLPAELRAQLNSAQAREGAVRYMLLTVMGLATLMAVFIGLFGSSGAIGGEIERGTILAVAARPIDRWEILLGKFIGNGVLVVLYLVVEMLLVAALLFGVLGIWVNDVLLGTALHALEVLIIVAVAVAASTRLGAVPNAVTVAILVFALAGPGIGILYGIALLTGVDILRQGVEWARFVLPAGPIGDLADQRLTLGITEAFMQAAGDRPGVFPIYDWAWAYGLVYLVGILLLGAWSLNRRDLR